MKKKVVLKDKSDSIVALHDTTDLGNIYAFYSRHDNHVIIIRSDNVGYYTNWVYADQMQEECYGPYNTLHKILKEIITDGYDVFEFSIDVDFTEWMREVVNGGLQF